MKFTFKHCEKTPSGPPLSLSALTLFDTRTAPDSLAFKHTESVTCENVPDLSNMSSFPQPLIKQKDHLCNDPSTKGFYLEHTNMCVTFCS